MPVKPGYLAVICVLAIVAVNAFALSAELRAGNFDVNDSVLHYTLVDRMVQAIERGENPLDFWVDGLKASFFPVTFRSTPVT
jgi:hypothetical protein